MFIIKNILWGLLAISIFTLGLWGFESKEWLIKGGITLAVILLFLTIHTIAKIAWRFLLFALFIFLILYTLSYFGIIEISLSGFTNFIKNLFTIKTETVTK